VQISQSSHRVPRKESSGLRTTDSGDAAEAKEGSATEAEVNKEESTGSNQ